MDVATLVLVIVAVLLLLLLIMLVVLNIACLMGAENILKSLRPAFDEDSKNESDVKK